MTKRKEIKDNSGELNDNNNDDSNILKRTRRSGNSKPKVDKLPPITPTPTLQQYKDWKEINIEELKSFKKKDIIKIGELIGINGTSNKKKELIEKIKTVIENRKITIKNDEIDKSINPFNQHFQIVNKDISNDELLFWKVFKNKFIFRRIMSVSDSYLSRPYDSIISVGELIYGNYINLLIDKVNRNQYLSFGKDTVSIFSQIFIKIQTNYQFYVNLFNNYNSFILKFNDQEYFSKLLIKCNCQIGLKVLVDHFNFKPTIKTLYSSIKHLSIESLKYLVQFNLQDIKSNEIIQIVIKHKEITPMYLKVNKRNKLAIINYLIEIGILVISDPKSILSSIFTECPITHSFKLNDLIEFNKFINLLLPQEEQIVMDYSIYSNEQLESNITDQINFNSAQKHEIKTMLDHFYKCNSSIVIGYEYYLCFIDNGLEGDTQKRYHVESTLAKLSLEFGNFKLYKKLTGNTISNHSFYKLEQIYSPNTYLRYIGNGSNVNIDSRPNVLFSKLPDKAKQFQFLTCLIQDIKNETVSIKIRPMFLFYILIQYDDIELVKYFVSEIGASNLQVIPSDTGSPFQERFIFIITRYIVSIKMLNYLYNFGFKSLFYQPKESTWIYYSNISLLKHWDQLSNHDEYQIKKPFSFFSSGMNLSPKFEIYKYIIENTNSFTINPTILSINCCDVSVVNNQYEYLQLLKSITYSNPEFNINIFIIDQLNYLQHIDIPILKLKFINWLYSTYTFENTNTRFKLSESTKVRYLYSIGKLTDHHHEIDFFPTTDSTTTLLDSTIYSIVKKCDLEILEIIIQQIYKKLNGNTNITVTTTIKSFLFKFLQCTIEYGQFKILEYIQLNHASILKEKSNSSGWFIQSELKDLIILSLVNNHFKISEFLLLQTTITKQQFKKSISPDINPFYNHFKNKLFK